MNFSNNNGYTRVRKNMFALSHVRNRLIICLYVRNQEYKINRLRVVHIIDDELNLVRRELITRRLLGNAERYGMVPNNNYGGRNGKTANYAVILKYLTLSSYQMQRRHFVFFDYDATACYDRILPHMLSMIYKKMSLPQQNCHWLIRDLVQMQYHMNIESS